VYIINNFQINTISSKIYLSTDVKGVKISNNNLFLILKALLQQKNFEINDEELLVLATNYQFEVNQLKNILINQLQVIKPSLTRKFPLIYINSDNDFINTILANTYDTEYHLKVVPVNFIDFEEQSLVIFYRTNYSHADFKNLLLHLKENVYLITAGVIHKLLIIDNL